MLVEIMVFAKLILTFAFYGWGGLSVVSLLCFEWLKYDDLGLGFWKLLDKSFAVVAGWFLIVMLCALMVIAIYALGLFIPQTMMIINVVVGALLFKTFFLRVRHVFFLRK